MSEDTCKIVVEGGFMDNLAGEYSAAAKLIDEMTTKLSAIEGCLEANYKGVATAINSECLSRYKEHLSFLKICLDSGNQFVSYAKETMIEQDRCIAQGYEGSGEVQHG